MQLSKVIIYRLKFCGELMEEMEIGRESGLDRVSMAEFLIQSAEVSKSCLGLWLFLSLFHSFF